MRVILAVLAFAALCTTATGTPASNTERLVRAAMEKQHIPGLSIAIVKNGRIVLSRSYGAANLQAPSKVGRDTVFAINSITKAFTGIAAMQMVEAGKLDLGAPVSAYLDDLPANWRTISIAQLLSHMSGLPDYTAEAAPKTDTAAMAWAKAQPLHFPPGEHYEYCQTNYALIALVLNKLKGRAPDSDLAMDQFRLAGMTHTLYGDSRDVILHRAESYGAQFSKHPPMLHPRYEIFTSLHHSSSGINATAEDMARWMIAVTNHRFLHEQSLQTMWTPVRYTSGKPGQWGLGWMIGSDSTHPSAGMTGGSRAAIRLYPKDGVGIVILTNLAGAGPEDLIDEIAGYYIPGFKLTGKAAILHELESHGFDKTGELAERLLQEPADARTNEDELNDWAYRLLATGREKDAVPVFELVTRLYPNSSNAFDSLGEAYDRVGDKPHAIEAFTAALKRDPANPSATAHLKTLAR